MSFGLKVWDGQGVATLDTRDRLTRIIVTHTVSPTPSRQSIHVPGFRDDGTWAVIAYSGSINISTSNDTVTYYRSPLFGLPGGSDDTDVIITIVRF